MQPKKRTPRSTSIDGFVRRQPASSRPGNSTQKQPRLDGFVRRTDSHKQISFADETWSEDDSTLTLDMNETLPRQEKKNHWWSRKKDSTKSGKKSGSRRPSRKKVVLIVLLLLLMVGGFLGWKFLAASSKVFEGNVLGFLNTTKLDGEDEGRVNILLAGTSEDDPDHEGAALTDSIMLVSVDTRNNTAFTTSIPRDLWVRYGGEQCLAGFEGKINNTYQCGESESFSEPGYPKGGMGLLAKVVGTNFGIPVQYYGKINYTAFRDAVDAVGGITITIDSDDPRGIYDPNIQPKDGGPVRLKNGPQKLDGKGALALARSRNVAGGYGMSRGDFDRTTYQRAMLIALKDKALSAGVLSNPSKIGGLLDAAGDNVETNFNTSELRRLHDLSKLIKSSDITSVDLADPELNLIKTGMYNGQSIVLPSAGIKDYSEIKTYFKKLTSTDPLVKEEAQVVVLNGSGQTGLAQKYADKLSEKGITVLVVSNADAEQQTSSLVDISDARNPKTVAYLQKDLNTKVIRDSSTVAEASRYKADYLIILGVDSIPTTTTSSR